VLRGPAERGDGRGGEKETDTGWDGGREVVCFWLVTVLESWVEPAVGKMDRLRQACSCSVLGLEQ
jgi:hypothetical protein